jgi:hypothetical protein
MASMPGAIQAIALQEIGSNVKRIFRSMGSRGSWVFPLESWQHKHRDLTGLNHVPAFASTEQLYHIGYRLYLSGSPSPHADPVTSLLVKTLAHAADSAFHKCAHMPMSRHWGQRRPKRMSDIRRPVRRLSGRRVARPRPPCGRPGFLPPMSFGHGAV